MEHKILPGPQGPVHYWTGGRGGNWLVFCHGATMDHGLFHYQVPDLSKRFRILNWDIPGHGLSRPYQNFSLEGAAADLLAILDQEEIPEAHLVGQSMGGYLCQILARNHPERVTSLTAVDSSPLQPSYYSAIDNWLLAITPSLIRLYPYRYLIKTISNQIALQEPARRYALETLETYSRIEISMIMDAVYRGVRAYQTEEVLAAPILIVVGEQDRSGKVITYSRQWAERESRRLVFLPEAAHNSNMDQPEVFNRILETFLDSVENNDDL